MAIRGFAVSAMAVMAIVASCKQGSSSEAEPARDESGAEAQPEASDDIRDPTAETGEKPQPDPLYPTARESGSEGVFALEEPDRGPLVTAFDAPSRSGMKTSRHGHCEVDERRIVCGPTGTGWRLSRSAKYVIAQRMLGSRVESTATVELAADKSPNRLIQQTHGVVDWSRHFSEGGARYTARERSGANALSGCGAHKLEGDDVAAVTCLQWMGKPMRNADGVVTRAVTRDKSGFVIETRYLDAGGQPATRHDGVHKVTIERDELGRPVAHRFFDESDEPRASSSNGCEVERFARRADGQPTETRCETGAGQLAANALGVAVVRYRYDAAGCSIAERYLDPSGKPAKSRFDGFGLDLKVDRACRPIERTCVSASGEPGACNELGYTRIEIDRDKEGNPIARRYFDAEGKPAGDPEFSVFEVRAERDDRGRKVRESCFGSDRARVECSSTGYHSSVSKYDDAGRILSIRFFDEKLQPTTNLGTFETRHTYDNYDHVVEILYTGEDGKPAGGLGASTRRTLYDAGHRVFAILLYMDDEPAKFRGCYTGRTCPTSPWHAVRIERSDTGELIKNHFFDSERHFIEAIDCRKQRCFGL